MKTTSEQTPEASLSSGQVDLAILDDDLDFRNYLEDALKDDGRYAIRTFGHPDELFAASEQRLPDIVLLDMKMGEFKGDQVLEELLAKHPNLCVIIITGYPDSAMLDRILAKGPITVLKKPLKVEQLKETVRILGHKEAVKLAA